MSINNFVATDLAAVCNTSIGAPIEALLKAKKTMTDTFLNDNFDRDEKTGVYVPKILTFETTNANGETFTVNVPKYTRGGKTGRIQLDSMDVNIEWNASAQYDTTNITSGFVNNIGVSAIDSTTESVAAKVSVNMKLSGNTAPVPTNSSFLLLTNFITSQGGTNTVESTSG
jgi:hypothetical protein